MDTSGSVWRNSSLFAVSTSLATGELLLAEAARGAAVSAWAQTCAPALHTLLCTARGSAVLEAVHVCLSLK